MSIIHVEKGYGWFPYGSTPYGAGAMTGNLGTQVEILRGFHSIGTQAQILKAVPIGFQAKVLIYNITNLRVLCDFVSRGLSSPTGGNNAWGNPDGSGLNWIATSTEPSSTNSFDVSNVNTDIVEQYWRSATGITNVTLDCDTEVSGIFLDTMAMLNTNLTTSATIFLQGSNVSNFSSIGFSQQITPNLDGDNVYISPELPITAYRYWRLDINDPTNTDNFIRIGTIVFGSSVIMAGECFVDRVERDKVNYTDKINTEANSNVQNDRGTKRKIRLAFRSLDFNRANYGNLQNVFDTARTILKCLWIPTPQYPKRFMTFGKLRVIPKEVHNVKSEISNYVDFNIEVDESL